MPKIPKKVDSRIQGKLDTLLEQVHKEQTTPLWQGPESSGPNGGVTQSLIGKFLCCRERFRLLVVEGLREPDRFHHRLEYGNMVHACEEARVGNESWEEKLLAYCQSLVQRYRGEQTQIDHWYRVCKVQYPVYLNYWSKNPDEKAAQPILREHVFDVPYKLPSGRTVRLRGKLDGVDLMRINANNPKAKGLFVLESKTKGEVEPQQIEKQLPLDLQSNFYMIALENMPLPKVVDGKYPISGVAYNVVRRPLSGGKHTIVRHKATAKKAEESQDAFYKRLGGLIEDNPAHFFLRMKMDVTPVDIENFKKWCLNPILESLCDWWESIQFDPFDPWVTYSVDPDDDAEGIGMPNKHHSIYPSGIWNPMNEGQGTVYDNYMLTGDKKGLDRVETLYRELL